MNPDRKNNPITRAPIGSILIRLTIPSVIGMLGIMIFNVVDTYYVGQLGTVELASISFTFPVIMLVGGLNLGIGIGVMSLLSRAFGAHNLKKERSLATAAVLLGILIAATIMIIGLVTIEPLFSLLGSDSKTMPFVKEYMSIWYFGLPFIVLPMIGDNILRGIGDTKTPSIVMLCSAVTNAILDPLLIFGIGPFPELGIKGAAIATVFARMFTALVSIYILAFREKLLATKYLRPSVFLKEWKSILYVGIPNSLVTMILPLAVGVFTGILSQYGPETVAGYGVAGRIEMFCMAIVNALGITAAVFIGQNLGAGEQARVDQGLAMLRKFALTIGLVYFVILFFLGKNIGALFNDNAYVQNTVGRYLAIASISYGLYAMTQINISVFNVLHKPIHAAGVSLTQLLILNVPMAFLFSQFWGPLGVFVSISISYAITGILSTVALSKLSNRQKLEAIKI